ncbi:surface antigen-like protein [Novymonas esmeraldas]|uniref:Surface antigen-like protein n=1 Tax=Novymonas esmeraldas TaxID=1808958 RepID=A0AAW0EVH6_9TRYP
MVLPTRRSTTAVVLGACLLIVVGAATAQAALTAAQNTSTLGFLRAFTTSIPALADVWVGTEWCTWPYIDCNSDTNITLTIDNAGLTGSLPDQPASVNGALVALTEISITNMNITGGFKDSWGGLRTVRVLNFTNTPLFGTIPLSWNAISALQIIALRNSSACGSLPSYTLRSLRVIDVSDNVLRGPLPATWGNIGGLQSVSLVGNWFCGCNPQSWVSRVLSTALFQAMGYAPFDTTCRPPINCATAEGGVCSRSPPRYTNGAAAPLCVALAAVTLLLSVVTTLFL